MSQNMLRPITVALALLVFGGISNSAKADLITFEGSDTTISTVGDFIDQGNYRFTLTYSDASGFLITTAQSNLIENWTTKLFSANHAEVTMTKIGGGAFDLYSLDLGGSWIDYTYRWADHVDIIAGSNVLTVNLPSNDPTYHFVTPNFMNVTSVLFRPYVNANNGSYNYEFNLDNISTSASVPTPEPSTFLLLGCSLIAAAACRKKIAGLLKRD